MKEFKLPKRLKGLNKYIWTILIVFLVIGWFYPLIGLIALICMLAPVVMASIKGSRKWCVYFCPRGVFNDVILRRLNKSKKIPAIFHNTFLKIAFLIFLFYNFFTGILSANSLVEVGAVFIQMVSITTGMTILLGLVFHPRTWCAFCPMGFLSNIAILLKKSWGLNQGGENIKK
ncbi:4Fe-4S binding protein [Natronospora cellulosivora (SeqCode)]